MKKKAENQSLIVRIQQNESLTQFVSVKTKQTFPQRRFLRIGRRNFQNISAAQLHNIFGYFGEVERISMLFEQSCIFVEYMFAENLALIMNLLQGLVFVEEDLQISIYMISNKKDPILKSLNSPDEVWAFENQQHSATSLSTPIFLNSSPSRFLEISGYPKNFSKYLFHLLLSEIHQPIFMRKNITRKRARLPSIIAEFTSVYNALEVLAGYQLQKVNNDKLVISFFNKGDKKQRVI